jgi:selenide,water dikinase
VALASGLPPTAQALVTDPQTSGGLLLACAPESVQDVLAVFQREGFAHAAVIGGVQTGAARLDVRA